MSSRTLVSRKGLSATVKQEPASDNTVSLYEIVREAIQQAQSNRKDLMLVFRCEALPSISCNAMLIKDLLHRLIDLILAEGQADSRLFLYINSIGGADQEPLTLEFHTNIKAGPEWCEHNGPAIQTCLQLASDLEAGLLVNEIKNTGCIFSLSFPVK
ncbi:MAG TPA: hypothetical protein VHK91_12090 [Flavisolibacter sp.]|jgi:hypothetical protein|nr:hypothetical protein [Flavisolibacter sp.]